MDDKSSIPEKKSIPIFVLIIGINTLIVRGGTSGSAVAESLRFTGPSNVSRADAKKFISDDYVARPSLGVN